MKAILVIDKAESCTGCLLGIFNKKWFCLATNKDIDICDRYNIPSWCPLRPLPEEKKANPHKMSLHEIDYAIGWNDCLDEITGDTECTTQKTDT